MVDNYGGLDPGEELHIYPGHQTNFLLLPYWLKELPGAAAGDGLLYDFVVVLIIFAGSVRLFGTGIRGVAVASATCLSPGFFVNVAHIDTVSFPALFGMGVLPFVAGNLMDTREKSSWRWAGPVLVAVYVLMNWSPLLAA
jgi:hypothetical protein